MRLNILEFPDDLNLGKIMITRRLYIPTVYIFISLAAAFYTTTAVLADEPALTEQQFFPDIPIVLSATRLPQSVEDAPVAVTIITREMIEASGATEIPDLLRLVPGFQVDYDNAHVAAVSYHMLPDRYVRQQQVLIDGRSVYDPLLGGVPWMELPITIDDIERIEVVRGANEATYGSNSFLGVINIITRSAILDKGTSIKTNIGTDGLREGFMRYGNRQGALDYRLNLAYRSDDGFDGRNDGKIVRLINSRFDYQLNDKDNYMFKAGYSEGPRQMDDVFDTGIPYHDMNTYSQYQQFKWQRVMAPEDELSLQVYHNQLAQNDSYTRTDVPVYFNADTTSERTDIEIQKIKRVNKQFRYVIGASYRLDQVASELYFGTATPLDNRIRRVFAQGEYQLDKNTLINLGLMHENNDITGSEVSPRAAVNYKLTRNNTLRLSVSKANRTPVIFEQYPNAYISLPGYFDQLYYNGADVKNEKITEYDLGLVGHNKTKTFHYDFKLYYEDITGLIGSAGAFYPSPDVDNRADYFDNFDNAIIRGFESGVDWQLNRSTKFHLALSHIYITSTNNRENYSDSAPSSMLSLLAMHNFSGGYTGSIFTYYRSSTKPLARHSYDPLLMDPYTRVDLHLAKKFRLDNTDQQIALTVRNLFNARQESVLLNNTERGVYLTYQIHFN